MTPRSLVLALLLALLAPAAAVAAEQQREVGAQAGGSRLLVTDRGDEVCLALEGAEGFDDRCRRPPRTPFAAAVEVSRDVERTVVAGMVPSSVAAVEVQHGRDARARVPAGLGAYTGRHGARVRFFAVAVEREPLLVRFFDAGGRLIGASEEGIDGDPRHEQGLVLRRGGREPGRWRLTARVEHQLDPRPDRPDRMTRRLCLSLTVATSTGTSCPAAEGEPVRLAPQLESGCGAAPRLLHTPVASAVRRLGVVLGSGRQLAVATRALPARLGFQARFAAVVLPSDEAVRRVLALDDRGRVLERAEVRAAPEGTGCVDHGFSGGSFTTLVGVDDEPEAARSARELAASTASGGRLLLGDRRDDLCLAVVSATAREGYCTSPPLDPGFAQYAVARARGEAVVAGVTTADARPPEFVLDDGTRLRPSLQEPGAYAGRYRAFVRVFAVEIPAGRRAVRVITRDAAGRVVLASSGPERPADADPVRSLLRTRAGGAVLDLRGRIQTFDVSYEGERSRSRSLCLAPRLGSRALLDDLYGTCLGDDSPASRQIAGLAPCAGRRVVLYGGLGARDRGVEVLLADGRRLRATTAAVPRSLGVDARVFAIVVPPRAAVRAVLVRRARSTLRLPAPLPPAVRQCGYGFELPEF